MVKAVLVADERTPWLEEVIDGLAAQDYKKIEFLLVLKGKEKEVIEIYRKNGLSLLSYLKCKNFILESS